MNARPAGSSMENEAFRFVSTLAQELSSGRIELPAIPDVAMRVGRALEDDRVSADRLERIVSSEPVLAGRVLQLANSAALNPIGSGRVTDLRSAINRIGFAAVRVATVAYALSYLRKSGQLQGLTTQLNAVWSRCTLVAAIARVVARQISTVSPDRAMFAGLMHGVGELYILVRIGSYPTLMGTDQGRSIVGDWNASVARAILENWEIEPEVAAAVAEYDNHEREHAGPIDLADVVMVSFLLASYMGHPEALELNMQDVRVCQRLGLGAQDYAAMLEQSRAQIDELRAALDY